MRLHLVIPVRLPAQAVTLVDKAFCVFFFLTLCLLPYTDCSITKQTSMMWKTGIYIMSGNQFKSHADEVRLYF